MSELSDYRRFVEAPMIRSYEATIEAQAVEISSLRGHLKDWQDSSEAYRIDCETAIARAETAEQERDQAREALKPFAEAWVWSCEFNVSVQSHIKVEDFRRAARAITGED